MRRQTATKPPNQPGDHLRSSTQSQQAEKEALLKNKDNTIEQTIVKSKRSRSTPEQSVQAHYADLRTTSRTGRQTRGQRNKAIQQKRQGTVTASGPYHKLEDQQSHEDNRHVRPRQPRKEEDRPTAHCQIQPKEGKPRMRKTGPRHTTSINPKGTSTRRGRPATGNCAYHPG